MTTMNYKTILRCPVCGKTMDEISHDDPEPSGMGIAMLGGDGRRLHAKESPDCRFSDMWHEGWKEETIKTDWDKVLIDALNTIGEYVAKHLPAAYSIEAEFNKDGASIELVDPEGEEIQVDAEPGCSWIRLACEAAKEDEKGKQPPIDPEWLLRMASKEDGKIVSVGGFREPKLLTMEQREIAACKVCQNIPDEIGMIEHGRWCYTQSSDGGGQSFVSFDESDVPF